MTRRADARPSRRELRDLACRGFHLAYLANLSGVPECVLGYIRRGERPTVNQRTADAIHRLHRQLRSATPTGCGVSEGGAARTRLIAARAGWTGRGRAA
jgi:hypothetical protein